MNTVLLVPEIFAAHGGIARSMRLYLKALCELSWEEADVGLVALNDGGVAASDLARYSNRALGTAVGCRRSKLAFFRAARKASAGARQLVCGHVGQLPVAWWCRKRNPQLQYYLVAHGIEVWRRFTALERIALRGAKRIWCVSEFTRREFLKYSRLSSQKTAVLPNALDPAFQPVESEDFQDARILTVSRLSRADSYKGVDHLISALPQIRAAMPQASLRIVGQGDDVPRLTALADSLYVRNAVHFLGSISDAQLDREFASAHLFALPSEKEGFGLVFLEAMAYGKPCIGANSGATPELIAPECGQLCAYGDVNALANVCLKAMRSRWSAERIRAHAHRFSYGAFRDRLKEQLTA